MNKRILFLPHSVIRSHISSQKEIISNRLPLSAIVPFVCNSVGGKHTETDELYIISHTTHTHTHTQSIFGKVLQLLFLQ